MSFRANPLLSPSSILLAAISLSIGWGIRGNFGHESGAMFPGALTTIALCLLSGREDWRERVAHFAFFGALGWGFGGSISYMQVVSYTHSGHEASQLYGYYVLFFIGFLWAAMGTIGAAIPAVYDRNALTSLYKPIAVLLAVWTVMFFTIVPLEQRIMKVESAMHRHESALYWFDTDWLKAFIALLTLFAFDVVDRQFEKGGWLLVHAAVGALAGLAIQASLQNSGWTQEIAGGAVRYYGDVEKYRPEELLTNMPNFLVKYPQLHAHVGWVLGLLAGLGYHFARHGRFRHGSSLFVHMAVGWWVTFLLFPVILDVRLTPPRGDNWSGIVGVLAGAIVYFLRSGRPQIVLSSLACGTIGGLGFSGMQLLKLLMLAPGNSKIADTEAIEAWKHWQEANWHSFLEQTYGFVNGIGAAVGLALLVLRVPSLPRTGPRRAWTEIYALTFALPVLVYLNMWKNVGTWTAELLKDVRVIPKTMSAPPLPAKIELPFAAWYGLAFLAAGVAFVALMIAHRRRPIAIVPASWLGRGQLLYVLLLWMFVVGNFGRAIPGFGGARLLTEGVITLNAVLATIMILVVPREGQTTAPAPSNDNLWRPLAFATLALAASWLVVPPLETKVTRAIYGDTHAGHAGKQFRFGPKATWRTEPLLKGQEHR